MEPSEHHPREGCSVYTQSMTKALHRELEVGVRDLRATLSRYLSQVAEGASLTVTDRGRPVARLIAADREPPGLQQLIETGRVALPDRPATDPATWGRPTPKRSVADLVAEQRR
jgi:prevent-host-death family protein